MSNLLILFKSGTFEVKKSDIPSNFLPTARALIGYFNVTWKFKKNLRVGNIAKGNTVTRECWPTTAVTARINELPALISMFVKYWDFIGKQK